MMSREVAASSVSGSAGVMPNRSEPMAGPAGDVRRGNKQQARHGCEEREQRRPDVPHDFIAEEHRPQRCVAEGVDVRRQAGRQVWRQRGDLGTGGGKRHARREPREQLQPVIKNRLSSLIDAAQYVRIERGPRGSVVTVVRVPQGTWRQNADDGHRLLLMVSPVANDGPSDHARVLSVH
jgi:hypothetical protein